MTRVCQRLPPQPPGCSGWLLAFFWACLPQVQDLWVGSYSGPVFLGRGGPGAQAELKCQCLLSTYYILTQLW